MTAQDLYKVDELQAMLWCKEAWRNVSDVTVQNCFNKVGIMEQPADVDPAQADQLQAMAETLVKSNIAALYQETSEDFGWDPETAEESAAVHPRMTEEEMLKIVMDVEEEGEEEIDDVPEIAVYTWAEKLELYNKVLDTIDDRSQYAALKQGLRNLRDHARIENMKTYQQTLISSYFSTITE
jgi:hypothetical protein